MRLLVFPLVLAMGFPALSLPAAAQAPAAFAVRSAADLAALCGATPGDANYAAAVYFCHGFLQGVAQYHGATRMVAGGPGPLFCPPSPPPAVATVAASFAAWMAANPAYAGETAIDGLTRWAQAAYRCAPRG